MKITRPILPVVILLIISVKAVFAEDHWDGIDTDEYRQAIIAVRNDLRTPSRLSKQIEAQDSRPTLPFSYKSADGHFLIHYTLEGDSAVAPTCTNSDGVPDWVYESAQIAERTYRLLIDTLGFEAPPVDDQSRRETDLYILDVGYDYAYTYFERPVTVTSRPYDYTAYTEIDNDYYGYRTAGLAALQVTIAHEYFHVVQLGYNWWENNGLPNSGYWGRDDQYFLEWCSTWIEERAYPEVNDYIQYTYSFFYKPNQSIWHYSYYAYSLGPFIRFILERYDEDLLVKVWERIKTDFAFEALQGVLADDYSADLAELWSEFHYRCYYTGERYDPELSLSSDAQDFPLLQITNTAEYDGPVDLPATVNPFAVTPFQVTFGAAFLCGLNVSIDYEEHFSGRYLLIKDEIGHFSQSVTLNENQFTGDVAAGDSLVVFLTNSDPDNAYDVNLSVAEVSENFRIATKIVGIYPNPYITGDYENLVCTIQTGYITRTIGVTWFDLRGRLVLQEQFSGPYEIGTHTLSFSSADLRRARLASGVYILQIEIGSKVFSRKICLLK